MNELPKRKHPRLKKYDYSEAGAYFVTLCTADRKPILSHIDVGRGLAPAETRLTALGKIAEAELFVLPQRYPHITISNFVIMPNHIHLLLSFEEAAGASPRPTLSDVVCAYKSLTTRGCKLAGFRETKLFQPSFYDHVVWGEQDFLEIWQYIDRNPACWAEDELYTKQISNRSE